jgi:Zinc-finger of C2H2 type
MNNKSEIIIDVKVSAESIVKKTYVCETCDKLFSSDHSLKKHIIVEHHNILIGTERNSNIVYRFVCPISNCHRSLKIDTDFWTSRKNLQQHFQKVHNLKTFACPNNDCLKKFSSEVLLKFHEKSCGKVFTCHCNCCFNSKEALQTHQKRKHPTMLVQRKEKNNNKTSKKDSRTVSTTTSGLGWKSTENLSFPTMTSTTSVFTSTDQPISSTKSTATDDTPSLLVVKAIKNSSTSTSDYFSKEESSNSLSSSSSQNKKNVNWSGDFDDSINIFDSDVKMEFYSAETQTDLNENLFNNNYTQTTFSDLYDFEKLDIQTQTNWDE